MPRSIDAQPGDIGEGRQPRRVIRARQDLVVAPNEHTERVSNTFGNAAPGSKPSGVAMVRRLAEESFILGDDGEVDELRSMVTGWRERDPVSARVDWFRADTEWKLLKSRFLC